MQRSAPVRFLRSLLDYLSLGILWCGLVAWNLPRWRLLGWEQALQYRLAAVLREFDQRTHFGGTPMRLPRWLHDHFGIACEKVRNPRALGTLPLIDDAFRRGELSYWKVRALKCVATSDTEEELLAAAQYTSAQGVEHIVRRAKQAECLDDVQAMIRSRSVSTRWDESGAGYPRPPLPVPGCNQDRYVEGHHIVYLGVLGCTWVHWAQGDKTNLDNLVLLCGKHHRAVHEMGCRIRRVVSGLAAGRTFEYEASSRFRTTKTPAPISASPKAVCITKPAEIPDTNGF